MCAMQTITGRMLWRCRTGLRCNGTKEQMSGDGAVPFEPDTGRLRLHPPRTVRREVRQLPGRPMSSVP